MIEYFADHMWQLWTVVAVVCLILELMNGDFFIMCFAIGGVCSAIAAAVGAGVYWQLGIFALCSVLSLFFVRPAALRYLHKNDDQRVSNADAIIGREGRVVETWWRPSRPTVSDAWPSMAMYGRLSLRMVRL